MPLRNGLVALALVALCAGAVSGARSSHSSAASRPTVAADGSCLPARGTRRIGGALLHVPAGAKPPLPMVVAFHGAFGSGPGFEPESGLSRSADRHGFAVLYPTAGSSRHFWSLNRASAPDDVARLRGLLPGAERLACADRRRVYATGVSNGGGFTARVACEMADTFAAAAPVAGGYSSLDRCPDDVHIPLLEIHGSADRVVPYEGVGADRAGDVRRFVSGWARRDGCDRTPRIARPARYVTWFTHRHCDRGYAVEHVRFEGTDHGWPGSKPPFPRHHPAGLPASELVWRFFAGRRLPR